MTNLDLIKEEILFKPAADAFYLKKGEAKSTKLLNHFAGKIRLVYKNKLVLTLPYFFQVMCKQYPAIWYYDEELEEYAPVYRKIKGKYYYFYFNDFTSPMYQQYRLSIEEGMLSKDVKLAHRFYKTYKVHTFILGFFNYSSLHYALYKEGYVRMEQIAENIENDLSYFQNISDITLEICDYFSDSQLPELYEQSNFINDKPFTQVISYMDRLPYAIMLEEWKNLLLKYFGETTSIGFKGMNENYFKDFTYRTELLFFTIWLHKHLYTLDYNRISEEDRKYYVYFFFDKASLSSYNFIKGIPWSVGDYVNHVWLSFMRRLFWRRLKVIAKF